MARPAKHLNPLTHYAAQWTLSLATLKRWSRLGAPLDNPRALRVWCEKNGARFPVALERASKETAKETEAGTTKAKKAGSRKPSEPAAPPAWVPPPTPKSAGHTNLGSAEALRRLQEEEALLKRHLDLGSQKMDAIREKLATEVEILAGMVEVDTRYPEQSQKVARLQRQLDEAESSYAGWSKVTREQWLKTAEQMRKYEAIVEESKRDRGELLPKEECEQAIQMAAHWLRISIVKFLAGHGTKLRNQESETVIQKMILEGVSDSLEAQLKNATKVAAPLQPWHVETIKRGYAAS